MDTPLHSTRDRSSSEITRARGRWAQLRAGFKFVALHHGASFDGPELSHRHSLADLPPSPPERARRPSIVVQAAAAPSSFRVYAAASIVFGTCSVIPYNSLLLLDPTCPLFISFVLHCAIVVTYLPRAHELIGGRQIPLAYHGAIVALGFTFNTLKASAFTRLPPPVCMLLLNLRLLVGAAVQWLLFGQRYSARQVGAIAVITVGVAWAGHAMQTQHAQQQQQQAHGAPLDTAASTTSELWLGALEISASLLALTLLQSLVKLAFTTYGERVDEQIFIQHLCARRIDVRETKR